MSKPAPTSDPIAASLLIADPQERLAWIVDQAKRTPSLGVEERVPAHRVPGCTSAVWLIDESSPEACRFRGDAEAPILRSLSLLICSRASGRKPADVAADDTDVIVALGLERYITPTRLHGLRQLQRQIRICAARHLPVSKMP